MAWAWFELQQVSETLKGDIPQEIKEFDLEDVGTETIKFIKGFSLGIIFRNYALFPNMNSRNPFTKNDEVGAMIKDGAIWVGINEGD